MHGKYMFFLVIVEYIPTKIYFALASKCYTRFDEKKNVEVYHYCMAKKCKLCMTPLVYKSGGNYPIIRNVMDTVRPVLRK